MTNADIIDLLAGLPAGHPLVALRDRRGQAKENAQRSFEALLEPREPGAFDLAERYAVATFTARLHGFDRAAEFYADLLSDEGDDLADVVERAAASGRSRGPYGVYREPGLQDENEPGDRWEPDDEVAALLGARLAAAFAHTHLLVFRPRESSAAALQKLVDAGWGADDIVTLSQLVSFLAFQLRVAWGLRVVAGQTDENGASA